MPHLLNMITAIPVAMAALDRLRRAHGTIILHITSAAEDSRTPMCLPAGELLIGAMDVLLGIIDGVAVYTTRSRPGEHYRASTYELDIRPGLPIGFSIPPAEGMLFSIRELPMAG